MHPQEHRQALWLGVNERSQHRDNVKQEGDKAT
ncbi:hypothetical protein Vch1786_II0787 [Vibrio cholerae O1 str. 2010EL-1786]|uniref:Uncharacterized protein n=2 Tax=Vibrio cholerae TaxID=666 RepID=Q9KKK1_VIBCH|nr:hypothetical protein VC_A1103 [Vibrio cholerae O1 biovar El Tor str. N16961]ACP08019.1 conserved hypothetical protein [Vibrio cholerae M66-2]ACP11953.1 conserved hypothetical protein [Vibrio cholerae O395]ACQ62208.1 hypothetical protein VCD_000240 [Vibrio cholerae MJ-1236]AET29205.1 hypothetical protein Vch1786_II0787 [Vibrio cholerae O1 str. 2010EL-1786]EEO10499.1 hypothetical protein VCC_001513 [Vibrio cholerae RC9]EEO13446.1 hypothetical protein VCB_002158 [Vibrio cholerae TMA 21]EEO17